MKAEFLKMGCRLGLVLAGLALTASGRAAPASSLEEAAQGLKASGMTQRQAAIERIAAIDDPRAPDILQALLDGRLVASKSAGDLFFAAPDADSYRLRDALTGQDKGVAKHDDVQKIGLTNRLRTALRKAIGKLKLNAPDPDIRLAAVNAMAEAIDADGLELLRQRLAAETDGGVKSAINQLIALDRLGSGDKAERLAAIELLKSHPGQEAVNRLSALIEKDDEGRFAEADADVRNKAQAALTVINSKIKLYGALETAFFGLSLGAVLVLAAIGLAITFGVMGVINMAHGELMMLGAYTTYVIQQLMPNHLDWSLLAAIPAAFLISGLVGIAIERGIIRFLYGRPLETLLATFGVSLFLQQTVRSIFSPLNRSVVTPGWMTGTWQINDFLGLTWNRFYIIIFCLLVFVGLMQILKRTSLGLEVRAVAQNRSMAKAMGIPTDRVDALTFGLGSGIAGVAGVALSQITNVGPNLGQSYIVDSFMVVVFGGVGNLWGTLLAGFSLGIANKLLEPAAGAVLAKILVLVFIILFIQKRPRGLFPQKGRAAEG